MMHLKNEFERIVNYATSFGTKNYSYKKQNKYLKQCTSLKEFAIKRGLADAANSFLLLESILIVHKKYLKYYKLIKKNKHEDAWQLIIDVEYLLNRIKLYIYDDFAKFKLDIIEDKNTKIQTLYPYKYFMSTGFTFKNYRCSICGEIVSIHNRCKHKKGHIYNGRWCYWICKEIIDFNHVAVVENPKDKHCIITKCGGHRFDFSLVDELVVPLKKPYLKWDLRWTKIRHPHEHYENLKETDSCPCESGLLYKDCCMKEAGILRPHVEIDFGQGYPSEPSITKCFSPPKRQPLQGQENTMEGIIMKASS